MDTTWYGEFELPVTAAGRWQTGPFRLWAQRLDQEWKVATERGVDDLDSSLVVEVPSAGFEPPEEAVVRRIGFQQTPEKVVLRPALADRPVVVSPEEPFHLPPGQEIVLYISTPVWVQLYLGGASLALLDEPAHRPTDTWFGPSTMRGELCYATKTAARMNLDNVPVRSHRVISVVEIRNRAKAALAVEKLKIPVVHQSVYAGRRGNLWTEVVALDHQEDGEMAAVRLGTGPPDQAPGATLISGPRIPMEAGLLIRTFGKLVG